LEAADTTKLYIKTIERMEADYEDEHTRGTIRTIMTGLFCSRTGLTETEVMELAEIPFAVWSPIFLTIQSGLLRKKGGQLSMYSNKMREAVQEKCVVFFFILILFFCFFSCTPRLQVLGVS